MTIKESIAKAIADLTDDKSQAARYMFVIALVVILVKDAAAYAPQIVNMIVGGLLVMAGTKTRT